METGSRTRFLRTSLASFAAIAVAGALAMPTVAFADLKSDMDAADVAATEASNRYEEAAARQSELENQINEKNAQIEELDKQIPGKREELSDAMVLMYKTNLSPVEIIVDMMSGKDLNEVMSIANAYSHIAGTCDRAMESLQKTKDELAGAKAELEAAKIEQDAAVAEADAAKQEALAKRDEARSKYNASLYASSAGMRGATSAVAFDEESARAWIMGKESGGRYDAQNGRYYGAYQLDRNYLNGDFSPENQDRVAQQYVERRYGSWMNAVAFWQAHHWY